MPRPRRQDIATNRHCFHHYEPARTPEQGQQLKHHEANKGEKDLIFELPMRMSDECFVLRDGKDWRRRRRCRLGHMYPDKALLGAKNPAQDGGSDRNKVVESDVVVVDGHEEEATIGDVVR